MSSRAERGIYFCREEEADPSPASGVGMTAVGTYMWIGGPRARAIRSTTNTLSSAGSAVQSKISNLKWPGPPVIPKLETEERPEQPPMVRLPRPMFLQQAPHERDTEQAVSLELFLPKRFIQPRP